MLANDQAIRDFRQAFRLEELAVADQNGWILSVRPGQLTLGSMVISSREGHIDFQDLGPEVSGGLSAAFATAERLAKDQFGAVRVNFVCLMMKDPIVHFHAVPRYDQPVDRYGIAWEDRDWPGPPTFGDAPTSTAVLLALVQDLRAAY